MKISSMLIFALTMQAKFTLAQEQDSVKMGRQIVTESLKGTVLDKNTRLPIIGATVVFNLGNDSKSVSTDKQGIFRFDKIPVGRQVLQVRMTGYKQEEIQELLITSGRENIINVEMEEQTSRLNEAVVYANTGKQPLNQMAMGSGRSFSPEETNRYAGAFFDPAKMAQSFPGAVAGGDGNEIIVRGNSPKALQWRLEGIEIVNPNHFAEEGAAGGGISMLNSMVLGKSDFYTGGLAAEYNNATAGVFDLRFRKGNTDKREHTFSVGVLGVGATLEGPFKKGSPSSYLLSYRYSSLSLMDKAGIKLTDEGVPSYQDLSFNFVFPTKKAGTFSLFGIGGIGKLNENAERDYPKWEERKDGQDMKSGFDAGSVGMKHQYIANDRLYFTNIVSMSVSRNSNTTDTLSEDYASSLFNKSKFVNTALRYAGTLNYRLGERNTLRTGLNASILKYDLYSRSYDNEIEGLKERINENGSTSTYDGFVQIKSVLGEKLTLNTGVHANYFDLSKTWSIEPRVGLNWKVKADQTITLGAGLYNRLEPLAFYFAKSGDGHQASTDPKLSPTKNAQAVLGYEKNLNRTLRFKTEVYYQHLFNVPVSSDPAINFSLLDAADISAIGTSSYRQLVNKGTGRTYGIELTLEKSLSKGYYFMATSSLFDSKFKALSGQEYNTTFNTRFVGNLLLGKEWTVGKEKNNLFGLNGKLVYAGGRKYSPVMEEESLRRDEEIVDQNRINTLTSDPYIRADFSASYRVNKKKVSHLFIMDIQNVLNRENTIGMHYNFSKRVIEPQKWSGIIPTINYRIEF
ncbi:TonB-dependent receptor [Sphingobacterium multivorum]|nr:TonB-dependent receptor [Sphingobacterium multivorum]